MTTYQSLHKRIQAATTKADLRAFDKRITRHYDNGTITAKELMRLDCLIMEKLASLDN
jgi:hypothetical protein